MWETAVSVETTLFPVAKYMVLVSHRMMSGVTRWWAESKSGGRGQHSVRSPDGSCGALGSAHRSHWHLVFYAPWTNKNRHKFLSFLSFPCLSCRDTPASLHGRCLGSSGRKDAVSRKIYLKYKNPILFEDTRMTVNCWLGPSTSWPPNFHKTGQLTKEVKCIVFKLIL